MREEKAPLGDLLGTGRIGRETLLPGVKTHGLGLHGWLLRRY
jgi:hypothetical protein